MLFLIGSSVTHVGTIYVNEGTLGAAINDSLGMVADVHVTCGAMLLMEDTEDWGSLLQPLHRLAA